MSRKGSSCTIYRSSVFTEFTGGARLARRKINVASLPLASWVIGVDAPAD